MAASAVGLAIAGGAVLGLAAPASAHNYLIASTPAVDGTLTKLPDVFEITTNDKLLAIGGSDSGFAFRIVGADGRYYEDGCVDVDGPSMTTTAALGPSGKYTVEWQIVSADGHTVSDRYAFTWKAPSGATAAKGSTTPPVCPTASTSAAASGGSGDSGTDTAGSATGAGSDTGWIVAGIAIVAAAAVGVVLALRRRPAAPEDLDDSDED